MSGLAEHAVSRALLHRGKKSVCLDWLQLSDCKMIPCSMTAMYAQVRLASACLMSIRCIATPSSDVVVL